MGAGAGPRLLLEDVLEPVQVVADVLADVVGDALLELELGRRVFRLEELAVPGFLGSLEGLIRALAEDLVGRRAALLAARMVADLGQTVVGTLQRGDPAVPRLLDVREALEALACPRDHSGLVVALVEVAEWLALVHEPLESFDFLGGLVLGSLLSGLQSLQRGLLGGAARKMTALKRYILRAVWRGIVAAVVAVGRAHQGRPVDEWRLIYAELPVSVQSREVARAIEEGSQTRPSRRVVRSRRTRACAPVVGIEVLLRRPRLGGMRQVLLEEGVPSMNRLRVLARRARDLHVLYRP